LSTLLILAQMHLMQIEYVHLEMSLGIRELICIIYTTIPSTQKETIEIGDGTAHPVRGVGTTKCTPSIILSFVLYVPSFPINLLLLSDFVNH
jgi:hypothetical protein